MGTAARLALFGVGLVAVFGVAATAANALVPADTVTAWTQSAEEATMQEHTPDAAHTVTGLAVEQSGYQLDTVIAPATIDEAGTLEFQVLDSSGTPVTAYEVDHEKELHLIVVRSDGSHFRHVHPTRDDAGTWSIPWTWDAAGSYRVYTDFQVAGDPEPVDVTLARTVDVAGDYAPDPVRLASDAVVDGFDVTVTGTLEAGSSSELTLSVEKNGEPVTALQPYLGAFGHLVALRVGDLAYLHVHPDGDAPEQGETSGPAVSFMAEAPTAGSYLLFFDFQVDGQVHTAAFTIDAVSGAADPADEHGEEH